MTDEARETVWIIEFQEHGRKWVASNDYDSVFRTKREAVQFLKKQGEKGLIYRVSKYRRESI